MYYMLCVAYTNNIFNVPYILVNMFIHFNIVKHLLE